MKPAKESPAQERSEKMRQMAGKRRVMGKAMFGKAMNKAKSMSKC